MKTMLLAVIRGHLAELFFVGPDLSTATVNVARFDFRFEVAVMSAIIASVNIYLDPAADGGVSKTQLFGSLLKCSLYSLTRRMMRIIPLLFEQIPLLAFAGIRSLLSPCLR